LQVYGTEAADLKALMQREPELAAPLHAELPYTVAALVWGLQHEQARTAEDLLFRRTRAGLLNAAATASCMTQLGRAMAD
jgi:glycerol-3-phosphate dehydrogenase